MSSTGETDSSGDPRLNEVDGDTGMPGELIGGDKNEPGSQAPPPGAEKTGTAISDAKGTSNPDQADE